MHNFTTMTPKYKHNCRHANIEPYTTGGWHFDGEPWDNIQAHIWCIDCTREVHYHVRFPINHRFTRTGGFFRVVHTARLAGYYSPQPRAVVGG